MDRPYLIIPKLIQQPTWGGTKIAEMKGWQDLNILQDKKIGQSYELFSGSKLSISIDDTSDPKFIPEIGFPDKDDTLKEQFSLQEGIDYINLKNLNQDMPLLIKINHARGNSFQLHVKHGVTDARWVPKAESWYYFEPGLLTFGIKKGINLSEYRETCIRVDNFMKRLSLQIISGSMKIENARSLAKEFIESNNPLSFVNLYESGKYEVIDPSMGGIQHSWEEDLEKYPGGNFLYEIQEDVMDPVSTIRAFDQGKIKDDGSIREVHIDDYFNYLDTNEDHNDITKNSQKIKGETVLTTSIYSMDVISLEKKRNFDIGKSFSHLFVRDGSVCVLAGDVNLKIGRGNSCFIPKEVTKYSIEPTSDNTVLLKTYLTQI